MNNRNKYVVFLDVDNTLSGTNSGTALVLAAYKKGLLRLTDIVFFLFILLLHKTGLGEPENLIRAIGSKIKGMTGKDFSDLGLSAFKTYLEGAIFSGARETVAIHRKEGARLVILSSSVEEICTSFAGHLSLDEIICTRMERRDGILTGVPDGKYCYGDEKRIRLIDYCRENGFDTQRAYYYADSVSDLTALSSVGNPVCINPDRKLLRHARKQKWEVKRWKKNK